MLVYVRFLLISLLYITLILAKVTKRDTLERNSVLGCGFYFSKIQNWDDQNSLSTQFYGSVCSYRPAFQSWISCISDSINQFSRNENNVTFNSSLVEVQKTCGLIQPEIKNVTLDEYYRILHNASHFIRNDFPADKNDGLINYPIKANNSYINPIIIAYHNYSNNIDRSNFSVYFYYLYFFICFFIASIVNYLNHANSLQYLNQWTISCKIKGFLIKCLYKGHHTSYVNILGDKLIALLPSRLETSILTNYIILNGIILAFGYNVDPTNSLFRTKSQQMLRLVADRAGILAFGNLPIIFLFGARNNMLMTLTDFDFATFISLHKWVGRIMILHSILHSSCYLCYSILAGSFKFSELELYYKCGILAMILLLLLFCLSLGYIRKNHYELFLYTHIALAVVFMAACWKHVENLGWKNWLIISIVMWIVERLARVYNILKNGGVLNSKLYLVQVRHDINDTLIRVSINRKKCNMHLRPGQYYFAYFMHPLIFWQSHPFTVIDLKEKNKIIIVLKPKGGASKVLYESLLRTTGILDIKVALEGPYGHSAPIHHSDNILLFAAGTGIPGPLFHAMDLSSRLGEHSNKKVKLVIIIRDSVILNAFRDELLILRNKSILIEIYLTRKPSSKHVASRNSLDLSPYENTSLIARAVTLEDLKTFAEVSFGRPNIAGIVESCVEPKKSLSILSCGAPQFVDFLRDITSSIIIEHPESNIDYYEEFQRW
ncbi:hypothetical protein C6P45_001403 [Maudiozyma exigua]|uniref:FAD-binding FR-type domain-containing protein n=1 Tax=Maudiozyma exigua TaxID=34358 RepID=A0A9P6W3B5_MAUEX|nr:hypothetical protein C6P45_001403 [Kazachstania exigua]